MKGTKSFPKTTHTSKMSKENQKSLFTSLRYFRWCGNHGDRTGMELRGSSRAGAATRLRSTKVGGRFAARFYRSWNSRMRRSK